MASVAVATAVSKPNVTSVADEIVVDRLRHADDRNPKLLEPRARSSSSRRRRSRPGRRCRAPSIRASSSADRSVIRSAPSPIDRKANGLQRLLVPSIVPPCVRMSCTSRSPSGRTPSRSEQSLEAVQNAENSPIIVGLGGLDESADDGVQPRAIAAGCQNADPSRWSARHLSDLLRHAGLYESASRRELADGDAS